MAKEKPQEGIGYQTCMGMVVLPISPADIDLIENSAIPSARNRNSHKNPIVVDFDPTELYKHGNCTTGIMGELPEEAMPKSIMTIYLH